MKVDFNFPHKEIADIIIAKCKQENSVAILAGGYLRDHVLGKPFKDLDFFVYVRNDNPYLFEEGLLDAIGYDFDTGTMEETGEQYDGGTCLKITIDGLIYNFVQVYQEPSRYVSTRFDYSLNQLYYEGTTIKRSRAFLETIKSKQVKCINPPKNPKRLEYLRAKFPEFVFPDLEKRKEASLWGTTQTKKGRLSAAQFDAATQGVQTATPYFTGQNINALYDLTWTTNVQGPPAQAQIIQDFADPPGTVDPWYNNEPNGS